MINVFPILFISIYVDCVKQKSMLRLYGTIRIDNIKKMIIELVEGILMRNKIAFRDIFICSKIINPFDIQVILCDYESIPQFDAIRSERIFFKLQTYR